jgi:deazaflavin-dependent oxidoreductase (nitroreductase family)
VLIASNFGLPSNPGSYDNLRAQPNVMITWKGASVEMHARDLQGAERQQWVDRSLEAYPWWQQYHRAAPRQIPVIMLEPRTQPER